MCERCQNNLGGKSRNKTVGSGPDLKVQYVTIQDEDAEAKINRAFDILFKSLENL